jgi:hypothetical protein
LKLRRAMHAVEHVHVTWPIVRAVHGTILGKELHQSWPCRSSMTGRLATMRETRQRRLRFAVVVAVVLALLAPQKVKAKQRSKSGRLKVAGNTLSDVTGRGGMRSVQHWAMLGPFPIGKGELDGDPTEQGQGGSRACASLFVHGGGSSSACADAVRLSELVEAATVKWKLLEAGAIEGAGGVVDLSVDDVVGWQAVVNGLGGGHEVLEWQSLLVARLDVDANVAVTMSCSGVASFNIDPVDHAQRTLGPFAGNPYFGADRAPVTFRLLEGAHVLRLRPRVKHRGQVRCVCVHGRAGSGIVSMQRCV